MREFGTKRRVSRKAGDDRAAARIAFSNPDPEMRCGRETPGAGCGRYRGISLLWTTIVIFSLVLIVGVMLDMAKCFLAAHQLQNAADAAALAGAQLVKTDHTGATNQAYALGGANYYVDGSSVNLNKSSDIILGNYYPQITDPDIQKFYPISGPNDFANAVKVVARCDGTSNPAINLNFGPIAGVSTANVSRYAIATSVGGLGAGILALGEDACPGILFRGTQTTDVTIGVEEGLIHVNSDCDCAVEVKGQTNEIKTGELNINGEYCTSPPGYEFGFPVYEDQGIMDDPLGCYPDYGCIFPQLDADEVNDLSPSPGEYWIPDSNSAENVLSPGYYSGGINIHNGNVRFEPGIYILDGEIEDNINAKGGLKIDGGTINGTGDEGVMFYILGGSVDIGGNPVINLTELVPWVDDGVTKDYEGMIIYQDPDNTTPARIIGTSNMNMIGTLYFPFNFVELGGTGDGFGSQIIANSLEIYGAGILGIAFDGRYNNSTLRVFLVE